MVQSEGRGLELMLIFFSQLQYLHSKLIIYHHQSSNKTKITIGWFFAIPAFYAIISLVNANSLQMLGWSMAMGGWVGLVVGW
jgi:hypothetical protein